MTPKERLRIQFYQEPQYDEGKKVIKRYKPDIKDIIKNKNRCAVIHMLLGEKETIHTMRASKISKRLGVHHSTAIYHLEFLERYELVRPRKNNGRGRSKWGLNTIYPNWIRTVYKRILKHYAYDKLTEYCKKPNSKE